MTASPPPLAGFDLTGPLPRGVTMLEASAGTGKTYTIAGLVTRWVAETRLRLPNLLVVTFTRAATAELRDRVRRHLVAAADHLEAAQEGRAADIADDVLRLLADAPADEVARRRGRLARALTDIDAATIATIHGFCQHVLDGLGLASDVERDAELIEDHLELIEEVVDDLFVQTYFEHPDRPRLERHQLLALGRIVVANPTTTLVPSSLDDPAAGLRLHLAHRIRVEVARRARRRRQLSYDDLLTRLDETLRHPERGGLACAALRQRYRIALIDEFQDTDPVQWSIVNRAFGSHTGDEPDRALVLIGDPKQAIYAFRGADVYAYLDAASSADDQQTLATSWRADAALLRAFDTFLDGATYGESDIIYRRVGHAPGHEQPRLVGSPEPSPLRLRLLARHDSLTAWNDKIVADQARDLIARDVAADVVRLLSAEPTLIHRDRDGAETGREPLQPRHLAVLVRSNAEARLVQDALQALDVPAVIGGAGSVFATSAAIDWQRLLDGLERPASSSRGRALTLSAWIGWTGDDIAAAMQQDWDRLHDDIHRWAGLLRERGVASLQRTVLLERRARLRLLARPGGERLLADLEHIGELIHTAATAEHLGTAGLADWLRERVDDAANEQQIERLRRLETDDEAVQVLTIHRSKGLEFPVVYCPFLWSSSTDVREAPVFHDHDRQRKIDVGGPNHHHYTSHARQAEKEARGEELRLLYVAMTRAKHQVVAWYAPAGNYDWSALGRLLLCRDASGRLDTDREAPLVDDEQVAAAARYLAKRCEGAIAVETVPAKPSDAPWLPEPRPRGPLATATFDRTLDEAWRRTSYSALTRLGLTRPGVATEPDEPVKDDEPATDAAGLAIPDDADPLGLRGISLPLAELPGGTDVGTFVHRVLEHSDFNANDLDAELARAVNEHMQRARLDLDGERVVWGLRAAIETPLGDIVGGLRLREVTRADRRDEVEFELPLARRPGHRSATVADLVRLLDEHLPDHDPFAGYGSSVPLTLLHRDLRGYLGGSIDLVVRRTRDDSRPVFHVIDYKTNRLAPPGEELSAWHYRPDGLVEAMAHGHYPLQALLYAVALHRTLRWRLPGYQPGEHLGSVLYLFIRGMIGPRTPAPNGTPCGVFVWQPPTGLIEATSDLLHAVIPP
ncbi:MAG: UvrD-helicase domain-containing protein [Nitriliruptorales bacterium]